MVKQPTTNAAIGVMKIMAQNQPANVGIWSIWEPMRARNLIRGRKMVLVAATLFVEKPPGIAISAVKKEVYYVSI